MCEATRLLPRVRRVMSFHIVSLRFMSFYLFTQCTKCWLCVEKRKEISAPGLCLFLPRRYYLVLPVLGRALEGNCNAHHLPSLNAEPTDLTEVSALSGALFRSACPQRGVVLLCDG